MHFVHGLNALFLLIIDWTYQVLIKELLLETM